MQSDQRGWQEQAGFVRKMSQLTLIVLPSPNPLTNPGICGGEDKIWLCLKGQQIVL